MTKPAVLLVANGDIMDQVVQEMLDHQGIQHDCSEIMKADHGKYDVLLLPRFSESIVSEALKLGYDAKSIVVAERLVDLQRVLRFFTGDEDFDTDRFEPFVNGEEAKLLAAMAEQLNTSGGGFERRDFWPDNAKACCVLTHDVDWLTYSPFHKAVLASGLGLRSLLRLFWGGLTGKNYGWNFDAIVEMEGSRGLKSTVFFMKAYEEKAGEFDRAVGILKAAGSEMALHASDGSHLELANLRNELSVLERRLGFPIRGVRHHILKFSAPKSWMIAGEAGLDYDATFARNRLFGFRGGVCFPYHPFSTSGRLSVLELPTPFMDFTALARGLRGKRMLEPMNRILETVEQNRGVLVVNFHNTYLNRSTFPDVVQAYETLLDSVRARGYWVATAEECVKWWTARAAGTRGASSIDALGQRARSYTAS